MTVVSLPGGTGPEKLGFLSTLSSVEYHVHSYVFGR